MLPETSQRFDLPGTESQQALDLLSARFPSQSGSTMRVVAEVPEGRKLSEDEFSALVGVYADVQAFDGVIPAPGFTPGQADKLRRAMSRKRSSEAMQAIAEEFYAGTDSQGLSRAAAKVAFDKMAAFAAFGFPKSHAVAFALLMVVSVRATEAARNEADRARGEAEAANAALRAAQTQLATTSRTQERLRIARDLHDVVGHQLTALSVNLQVASRTATGPAKDDLEVCRAVASDLLRDVREVVSQLRETPSAGPEFAEELRTIGHSVPSPVVDVDVADDLPPLGAAEADVVRRCIQEIVTNAVRHSGATSVWIAVEELDGVVSVTARDDGQGSGRDGADVVMGHGLTGMVERFEALGGSVAWTARPGQGFTLQASVPVGRVAAT